MRIAVDMDEVVADTHTAKAALYGEHGWAWSAEELAGRKSGDLTPPEVTARVEEEMQKGLVFASAAPMEDPRETLETLSRRHEIFIARALMECPASCVHKIAWMRGHFPFADLMSLVLCGDKSVIAADVLIDDSPRHFGGFGVCFSALHNRGAEAAYRLDCWRDAPALVERIEREHGL